MTPVSKVKWMSQSYYTSRHFVDSQKLGEDLIEGDREINEQSLDLQN